MDKKQLRELHQKLHDKFKTLGTNHINKFLIAFEEEVEEYDIEQLDYLTNYFKACVRGHKSNNLGCNQAIKFLQNAYKKVYKMTV